MDFRNNGPKEIGPVRKEIAMTVVVSFSTVLRFAIWLVVTGVVAGALLLGQPTDAPAGSGEVAGMQTHAVTE